MPSSTLQRLRRSFLGWAGIASGYDVRDLRAAVHTHEQQTASALRQVTTRLDRLEHKIEAVLSQLEKVDGVLRRGRLRKVDDNVDALIRHTFLSQVLPQPQATLVRRFRGLSQNEEDGIAVALFDRIGAPTRRFVEVGAGVNGGNSGFLARECGWSGVMLEIHPARVRALQRRFGPAVTAVQARVTRENINGLLSSHGAAGDIDLLSVDIDGIDYWVWEGLSVCRPRLVIAEYNASFGATRSVTVPYDPEFNRRGFNVAKSAYYGASLLALSRLGARKGYRLVVVEPRGVNAFFVREDLVGDLPALSPDRIALGQELDDAWEPEDLFEALRVAGLPLVEID